MRIVTTFEPAQDPVATNPSGAGHTADEAAHIEKLEAVDLSATTDLYSEWDVGGSASYTVSTRRLTPEERSSFFLLRHRLDYLTAMLDNPPV